MSIAVSVLTTSRVARNSGGAARQENRPQSATAHSSNRCAECQNTTEKYYLNILVVYTYYIYLWNNAYVMKTISLKIDGRSRSSHSTWEIAVRHLGQYIPGAS